MTSPRDHRWNAADYARNSSAQAAWARELLDKLALRGDEQILDIGCGDGRITAQLAAAVPQGRVLGMDLSADMIALARETFPKASHSNLAFERMDAAAIRLEPQFDLAFSTAALHWVSDQRAVLRGVRACLKPGARILFQLGGQGNCRDVMTVMDEVRERPRWQRFLSGFASPYNFCGPEEYRVWLEQAGFQPRRVELLPKDMQHENAAALKGWLRTTWFPYTDRLPEAERDAFLDELLAAYLESHPVDARGRTHVAMMRLEVEADAEAPRP